MRKRAGFTLAEVLITLGIIGVVAAITLPNLMFNGAKQELGVKLAKFHNQLEKATRTAVINNEVKEDRFQDVLLDSLIFKNGEVSKIDLSEDVVLKDGTFIRMESGGLIPENLADPKLGRPVDTVYFNPNIKGLQYQKYFAFTITELGYVLPSTSDPCYEAIYKANWQASKIYNAKNCSYKPCGV